MEIFTAPVTAQKAILVIAVSTYHAGKSVPVLVKVFDD